MSGDVFPIGIFCSDLHLSATAPPCRADEPDWKEAQRRPLCELADLRQKLDKEAGQSVPIFFVGDIFDRWNVSPEVINFALNWLPFGYAVYGNHDLPNHAPSELYRSAYATLALSQKMHDMSSDGGDRHWVLGAGRKKRNGNYPRLIVRPFPYGRDITRFNIEEDTTEDIVVAMIHSYIWTADTGYPGASVETSMGSWTKKLVTYDVAFFGDNHKGFHISRRGWDGGEYNEHTLEIFNCGGFIRRKSDEREYRPRVGVLYSDKTVVPHFLDTSKDKFNTTESVLKREQTEEMRAFVDVLLTGCENPQDSLDYRDAVHRALDKIQAVESFRRKVLAALGE